MIEGVILTIFATLFGWFLSELSHRRRAREEARNQAEQAIKSDLDEMTVVLLKYKQGRKFFGNALFENELDSMMRAMAQRWWERTLDDISERYARLSIHSQKQADKFFMRAIEAIGADELKP